MYEDCSVCYELSTECRTLFSFNHRHVRLYKICYHKLFFCGRVPLIFPVVVEMRGSSVGCNITKTWSVNLFLVNEPFYFLWLTLKTNVIQVAKNIEMHSPMLPKSCLQCYPKMSTDITCPNLFLNCSNTVPLRNPKLPLSTITTKTLSPSGCTKYLRP